MFTGSKTFIFFLIFLFCRSALAQSTSRGPGKGPSSPGTGSKYTYPQPKKSMAVSPESYEPASEIPQNAEKYSWKLSNKNSAGSTSAIPVYSFDPSNNKRILVGQANVGEPITLDEVRVSSRRNHYKFDWKGSPRGANKDSATASEFWIDGLNIEFAGKK